MPIKKIQCLPNLSLKSPQNGLEIIQATAEIEKIKPTWNSLKPKFLTSGGSKINIVDCPAPTNAKAIANNHIERGALLFECIGLLISSQRDKEKRIFAVGKANKFIIRN